MSRFIFPFLLILSVTFSLFAQTVIEEGSEEVEIIADTLRESGQSNLPAILLSAALPGLGERKAGQSGFGHFLTETAIWTGFIFCSALSAQYYADAKAFASQHANTSASAVNSDHSYYETMGKYTDIYEYNQIQRLNRDEESQYNVETQYWRWESDKARSDYESILRKERTLKITASFALGAAVAHRIVSMVNTRRLLRVNPSKQSVPVGFHAQGEKIVLTWKF